MSQIQTLFGPKTANLYRYQNGIFELVVTGNVWICRIGLRQWEGTSGGELEAMTAAFRCAGDQIRAMVGVQIKLKKLGEL